MNKTSNTIHVFKGGETVAKKMKLLAEQISKKDSADAFAAFIKAGNYKDDVT